MTLKIISYIPNRFRVAFLLLLLLSLGSILVIHLDLLPSSSSPETPPSLSLARMAAGGGGSLAEPLSQRVEGLKAHGKDFTLNKRPFFIASGALHYFRVVPEYWLDRLTKLKAAGSRS